MYHGVMTCYWVSCNDCVSVYHGVMTCYCVSCNDRTKCDVDLVTCMLQAYRPDRCHRGCDADPVGQIRLLAGERPVPGTQQ